MLQESPKNKDIGKNRKGHPKVKISKKTVPSTKKTAMREPSAPLSRYTKLTKYKTY